MSRMRSSMSKKNKWYIDPERYLELKHFCRQYHRWTAAELKYAPKNTSNCAVRAVRHALHMEDPVYECVEKYMENEEKIQMVNECCEEADYDICDWIRKGVTEGLGYEELRARGIPCGKDYYYEAYHKFFYILDKKRK